MIKPVVMKTVVVPDTTQRISLLSALHVLATCDKAVGIKAVVVKPVVIKVVVVKPRQSSLRQS